MFFVSFVLALSIASSTRAQSDDSCLNLTLTQSGQKNSCGLSYNLYSRRNVSYNRTCMQCAIENIAILIRPDCTRQFHCAIYTYPSDTIFELFFRDYARSIKDWFAPANKTSDVEYFTINIDTFSRTEISTDYLEELLPLNMHRMNVDLKLKHSIYELNGTTISDSFALGVAWINILLPCKNANQSGALRYVRIGNGDNNQSMLRDECVFPQVRFWSIGHYSPLNIFERECLYHCRQAE